MSMPLPATPSPDLTGRVVAELRAQRRRRRLGDTSWGDLAYRAYTTALFCVVVAMMLAGWVGDRGVEEAAASRLGEVGPAWAGLLVAVAIALGVRSGGRGGPLALEAADVHHLLLSPADRGDTLRRPSVEVLVYGSLGGAALAGLAGALAAQRLPGTNSEWVACNVLFGATAVTLMSGAALLTCSRRLPRPVPLIVATVLLVWAAADTATVVTGERMPAAPTTYVGRLAFWPLRSGGWGLPGVGVAIGGGILGVALIGGLSIEAARRRTLLVGQLRFAVTVQDLRSVVLLRRQLASERPRSRRWFPVARRLGRRFPVLARDLESVAHWPTVRIARVAVLCTCAGLCVRGVWAGTSPLVVVAGVATFVAALDATEPLAQEIDHPTLTASMPLAPGELHARHLVAPCLVMVAAGAVGVLAAWVVDPVPEVLRLGPLVVLIAAPAAVAGAAISVLAASAPETSGALLSPEVAGPRLVVRTAWPPLVAVLGFVPALIAARTTGDRSPAGALIGVGVAVLVLTALVAGWVRFRDDIHRSMAESMGSEDARS